MAIDLRWGAPLTYADLEAMPEDGHRYELIDGALVVAHDAHAAGHSTGGR